jgi:uncharacterized integral membrane protein
MLRIFLLMLLVMIFAFGIVIGFYNAQPVTFNYLFGITQLPLIALIAGEFIVAVVLTLLVVMGRIIALKAEARRLRKRLGGAEGELRNLRNLPLKDA